MSTRNAISCVFVPPVFPLVWGSREGISAIDCPATRQDEMLQLVAVSLWSMSRALSVMDHSDMIMWKRDAQAGFLETNTIQLESCTVYL